jgi:hypothetical protein
MIAATGGCVARREICSPDEEEPVPNPDAPAAASTRARRPRWWVTAAVVGVLAVTAGVVAWWGMRFPARHEALAGTQFDLLIQPGTSPRDIAAVRDGLLTGDHYLRTVMGAGVDRHVEVRLSWSNGCEPFSSPAGPPTAWANAEQMCVHLKAPAWRSQLAKDPAQAQAVAAHEEVHTVQAQLGCLNQKDDHEWLWLSEGMAVHIAFQSQVAAGRWADSAAGEQIRQWGVADPTLGPLATYERGAAGVGDPAYALFHLATRYLDNLAPRRTALLDFCRSVAAGSAWRDAFAQAFGLSVDTFYARFAEARPELIAPAR